MNASKLIAEEYNKQCVIITELLSESDFSVEVDQSQLAYKKQGEENISESFVNYNKLKPYLIDMGYKEHPSKYYLEK